jgi:hypothetical protein
MQHLVILWFLVCKKIAVGPTKSHEREKWLSWANQHHLLQSGHYFTNLVVHKRNNWIQFSNNKGTTPDKRHATYNENSLYICMHVLMYINNFWHSINIHNTRQNYIKCNWEFRLPEGDMYSALFLGTTSKSKPHIFRNACTARQFALSGNNICSTSYGWYNFTSCGHGSWAEKLYHSFTSRITWILVLPTVLETWRVTLN